MPSGVSGDDSIDLFVVARCQVELVTAIVDQDFWFEDLKVPQCMHLLLSMLHIPVRCYQYSMGFIFIGEVNAGCTPVHMLFLLP